MNPTPDFLLFFGRFHPLVLHLPIGFLILAGLMEIGIRWKKMTSLRPAVSFALGFGAISAAVAALLGYLLSLEGGYDEELLSDHLWLGVATAIIAIGVYVIHQRMQKGQQPLFAKAYLPVFGLMGLVMILASHHGGQLTHGSSYLVEYAPNPVRSIAGLPPKSPKRDVTQVADYRQLTIYQDLIQPIFESRCISCHNPSKAKGNFLMDTPAHFAKGGDEGIVLVPGNEGNSPLYQRLLLPKADDKHMPPAGKGQLSDEQIALVGWWISQGAPFDSAMKVGGVEVSDKIAALLERKVSPPDPGVFGLSLDDYDADDLAAARKQGIWAMPLAQGQPFLEARISYTDDISLAQIKALLPLKEQLIYLDLGHSNIDDQLLQEIGKFPHLSRLQLAHTQVSDAGLSALQGLDYLESLNLYGTSITDTGLQALSGLTRLKRLYVWQTKVTKEGADQLMAAQPELEVMRGDHIADAFGSVKLASPKITAYKTLFVEEQEVAIELDINGIDILYTLDGQKPGPGSQVYEGPFKLNQSATLKAIAIKEGWDTSEVAVLDFIKVSIQPKSVRLKYPPSQKYFAEGPKSLIDLKQGTDQFNGGYWLGFEGKDMKGTIDLGKKTEVTRVVMSCMDNNAAWIFYPIGMEVEVSMDGKSFRKVSSVRYPIPKESASPSLQNFSQSFPPTEARYLRVTAKNITKNPAWHPNPGGNSWLFVDEVMVE